MFGWIRRHALGLLAAASAGLAVAIVGTLALAVVTALGAVVSGGSVLATALPFLLAAVALGAVELAVVVGLVYVGARRAASRVGIPTDERVARALGRLESRSATLADLGLAERFAPDPEERRRELRRQYVDGEIDELEFERRMEQLLDDDTPGGVTDAAGPRWNDEVPLRRRTGDAGDTADDESRQGDPGRESERAG